MSVHNRDLPAELERLESIEARLNQNTRGVKFALIGVSLLSTALLMLVLFHIIWL